MQSLNLFQKAVALGADYKKIYLTFQSTLKDLELILSVGASLFASLLGAYKTQLALGIAAIGGKDSMSGSFNDLDVPPTLTSFAVAPVKADKVISQEIKKAGSRLVMFTVKRDENDLPRFDELKKMYDTVHQLILDGKVLSASVVKGIRSC